MYITLLDRNTSARNRSVQIFSEMVLVGKITTFFHPAKRVGQISERTKTILYLLDIRSICCVSLSHRKSRKHGKIWNSFYDRPRARQRIDSSELCTCTARTPLHRTTNLLYDGNELSWMGDILLDLSWIYSTSICQVSTLAIPPSQSVNYIRQATSKNRK